ASTAFAATLLLLGFGVERTVYHLDGIWAELTRPYPVNTLGDAGRLWLELFIMLPASMVSGWLAGMIFYLPSLWVATGWAPLGRAHGYGTGVGARGYRGGDHARGRGRLPVGPQCRHPAPQGLGGNLLGRGDPLVQSGRRGPGVEERLCPGQVAPQRRCQIPHT